MESTHTASIDIPELIRDVSIASVFPGMAYHSLLSVGQLCNEGYSVTFKIDAITIYNPAGVQVLRGARDLNTGLWRINLQHEHHQHSAGVANNVYELRNTGALVNYLHKAMFSPTKSALLQDVKRGHLITWPGLTEHAINTYLKLTPATAMGHMNKRLKNIRSTSKVAPTSDANDEAVTPASEGPKTHLVYAVVLDQGKLYTDLTGRFPVRSSKCSWYLMVCYLYDSKYIKVFLTKSRSKSEWVKSYELIHQEMTSKGFQPKLQTLDNEASASLKTFFAQNDVEYQLVPSHYHRRNAAERAIHTFKERFFSGLATVDPDFPLHLWDHLLPQADLTLNLLRSSRQHPQSYATTHYRGLVNYNITAFYPPGCKIIANEKPSKRRT
jgi:hypothetical protein